MAQAEPSRIPIEVPRPRHYALVEKGDNLWKISDRHVSWRFGREATYAEVANYWRKVIESNRDSIRSGDPDLIHPGERIALPAIEALSGGR